MGENVGLLIVAVLRVVVIRANGSVFFTVLTCIIVVQQSDICRNRRLPRHQVNLFMQFNIGGPVAIFILPSDLRELRDCPYSES